ncbi:MAG: nucleoside triphosphate pyrophosphohydrolase [Gammaproteobacteria bacterium]
MLSNTQRLLQIMSQLRDPKTGCSWDVKQDFYSLIPYTIEEAYEVADAIERDDWDDLRAELGDLLLQVVFHARIAEERGLFDFEQVAEAICEKLYRRHPHVFAGAQFKDDEERKQAWEIAKAQERQQKKNVDDDSVLSGIAGNLPALVQCEKIQNRAASHGFDWPEVEPVFEKVREELEEVKDAWMSGDQTHVQEEVGDLLLVVVNLARHMKVNPEIALKESNRKFSRRFRYIETQVAKSGRQLRDCELAELDAFWFEAKKILKHAR